MSVAALYVETGGCYFGLPGVDPWDEARDARRYAGPHPVVAHPPCQRWGRYWGGAPRKPNQYKLGADEGCFAGALAAVRQWGGVLEHPEASHAWEHFGLNKPPRHGGWVKADDVGGWTCCVEQGHYGHLSRKATWLYANGVDLPELRWGPGAQRIHPVALAKHGYEKARRIGMMAMVGGKDKTRIRNATPTEFRGILLSIARTARANNVLKQENCILQTTQHRATNQTKPNEYPAKSAMENFVFELKITANDANELANQVGMLAVALSAAFTPRAAAQPPVDNAFVEAGATQFTETEVAKAKKTRAKKGQTIDHDPNEGEKTDVLRTTTGNADVATDAGVGSAGEGAAIGAELSQTGGGAPSGAGADAAPAGGTGNAEVDANAPADVTTEKAMTFDELKAYGIAYLNDTIPKADDRKAEYRAILDHFKVEKFGDLTPEQYAPFQVEVDRRRAVWTVKKAS